MLSWQGDIEESKLWKTPICWTEQASGERFLVSQIEGLDDVCANDGAVSVI